MAELALAYIPFDVGEDVVHRTAVMTRQLKSCFPRGVTAYVLPGRDGPLANSIRLAGLRATPLASFRWPFGDVIARYTENDFSNPTLVGGPEIAFHDSVRDDFARQMGSRGAAIIEVPLTATFSRLTAVADILARGPGRPGDTPQVVVEVKTGMFSDLRYNQQYIYALALVGEHLQSFDARLTQVGLLPNVPIPAMDFLLISVEGPGMPYEFALIKASAVNGSQSIAQIMAAIKALGG